MAHYRAWQIGISTGHTAVMVQQIHQHGNRSDTTDPPVVVEFLDWQKPSPLKQAVRRHYAWHHRGRRPSVRWQHDGYATDTHGMTVSCSYFEAR